MLLHATEHLAAGTVQGAKVHLLADVLYRDSLVHVNTQEIQADAVETLHTTDYND